MFFKISNDKVEEITRIFNQETDRYLGVMGVPTLFDRIIVRASLLHALFPNISLKFSNASSRR